MKKSTTAETLPLGQKFCPLCNGSLPRTAFYGSSTGSDGLMPFCAAHLSPAQAEYREAWACQQLRRAGIHPHSPLVPTLA